MDNNYKNVKEFIELTNYDTVNQYLKAGWVSGGWYTTCYDTEGERIHHQTTHYRLYWDKDDNPQHPTATRTGTYY